MTDTQQPDYVVLTVQLLSAYVTNNMVPSSELAGLIQSTRAAMVAQTAPSDVEPVLEYVPAASVRKSLASREHIISLIDGRPYKTLKRHLASHGLTPAQYRERYGLAASYPMVAPGYSAQRREVAQRLGLGQRGTAAKAAAASAAISVPEANEPAMAEIAAEHADVPAAIKGRRAKAAKTSAASPEATAMAPLTDIPAPKAARKAPVKTGISVASTDAVAPAVEPDKAPKPAKTKAQPRANAKKTSGEPAPKATRTAKTAKNPRKTLGIKIADAQATPEMADS